MANVSSCRTYGYYTANKLNMQSVLAGGKTQTLTFYNEGENPALIINIPSGSHTNTITLKAKDGSGDKTITLKNGGINVIYFESRRFEGNDSICEAVLTTTAGSVTELGATAALLCHANVVNY